MSTLHDISSPTASETPVVTLANCPVIPVSSMFYLGPGKPFEQLYAISTEAVDIGFAKQDWRFGSYPKYQQDVGADKPYTRYNNSLQASVPVRVGNATVGHTYVPCNFTVAWQSIESPCTAQPQDVIHQFVRMVLSLAINPITGLVDYEGIKRINNGLPPFQNFGMVEDADLQATATDVATELEATLVPAV
jgi:hypothetical protein